MKLNYFVTKIVIHWFKRLPEGVQGKWIELILRYLPLPLIRKLPFSYGAYLTCCPKTKGGVVFDCGAHVGNCAILFSRVVGPNGLVVCIEPFKDSYRSLLNRIKKLKLENVTAVNRGVWKTSEFMTLDVFQNTIFCRLPSVLSSERGKDSSIQINCISIDDLVSELGLHRLDFIKMDIEGAEIEALIGARKTLAMLKPRLGIASYHIRDGQKTFLAVENILLQSNYICNTFFPSHLTTCGKPR